MQRPSRAAARWVAAVAVLLVTVAAIIAEVLLSPGHAAVVGSRNDLEHFVLLAVLTSFVLNGVVVLVHRPRNPIGWILIGIGGSAVWNTPLTTWGERVLLTGGEPGLVTIVGLWINGWYWPVMLAAITFYLPVLFPDGHLPSPRWRPVAWVVSGAVVVLAVMGMTAPVLDGVDTGVRIRNPIGVAWMPSTEGSTVGGVLFLGIPVGLVAGVTALVVRFRRSRGAERQQLKWFLAAASLLLLLPLGEALEGVLDGVLPQGAAALWFPLVIVGLPSAITIAVLRHRLWDIDRIVSRTLAYALLVALLLAVYLVGVLGLGAVARAITGESGDLVVAVSTLAVAAAFQPLRRRLRDVVDRRFNRARYDASRTVDAFGRGLRDEVSRDAIVDHLHEVAVRTVRPAFARIVLTTEVRP